MVSTLTPVPKKFGHCDDSDPNSPDDPNCFSVIIPAALLMNYHTRDLVHDDNATGQGENATPIVSPFGRVSLRSGL